MQSIVQLNVKDRPKREKERKSVRGGCKVGSDNVPQGPAQQRQQCVTRYASGSMFRIALTRDSVSDV